MHSLAINSAAYTGCYTCLSAIAPSVAQLWPTPSILIRHKVQQTNPRLALADKCFMCGEQGHRAIECPTAKEYLQTGQITQTKQWLHYADGLKIRAHPRTGLLKTTIDERYGSRSPTVANTSPEPTIRTNQAIESPHSTFRLEDPGEGSGRPASSQHTPDTIERITDTTSDSPAFYRTEQLEHVHARTAPTTSQVLSPPPSHPSHVPKARPFVSGPASFVFQRALAEANNESANKVIQTNRTTKNQKTESGRPVSTQLTTHDNKLVEIVEATKSIVNKILELPIALTTVRNLLELNPDLRQAIFDHIQTYEIPNGTRVAASNETKKMLNSILGLPIYNGTIRKLLETIPNVRQALLKHVRA